MSILTDRERWVTVREFPTYQVSNRGEVFNTRTQKMMKQSRATPEGHLKITLTDFDGSRHTRSVALMVAEAFVKPPNFMCDCIIVLDGDFSNLSADNLAWRTEGLSWRYTHQLKVEQPLNYHNLPVRNIVTGKEYKSIVQAGISEGLLFEDIWMSMHNGWEIFPYGAVFEVIR